jgi:hypothetical protein
MDLFSLGLVWRGILLFCEIVGVLFSLATSVGSASRYILCLFFLSSFFFLLAGSFLLYSFFVDVLILGCEASSYIAPGLRECPRIRAARLASWGSRFGRLLPEQRTLRDYTTVKAE